MNEVNRAPVLGAIGPKSVNEQETLTFTAIASDQDLPADTLTFGLDEASIRLGMSINASTGEFSWTTTELQGGSSYNATITVSDGAATDEETIEIAVAEVNVAPVLDAIGNQSINEQATLTFTATASDQDLPADILTFSLDQASLDAGMTIDASTGEFSWTPTEAQGGTIYNATITVTDGGTPSLSVSETITITVNEVNVAPVLDAIGNQSINEQATLTLTATASDQDLPADTLTFSLDAGSIALGMSINASTGEFFWTPTESQGGSTYNATITVSDGAATDEETIEITVNDAPTTTGISDVEVAEDALDTVIDLFAAFDDVEDLGADLTYTIQSNSNPNLFTSASIDAGTGTLTLDYAPDSNGSAEITVLVTDKGGLTVEATFTVTVLSAEEQVDQIIDMIVVLNDAGVLNNGGANPPLNFLDQAIRDLGNDKTTQAIKKLNDFIDRIQDLIDDETLTLDQGQPLIDEANAAITAALPG